MSENLFKVANQLARKNNSRGLKNLPSLFFFTDRRRFENIFLEIEKLPKGAAVIVREYDLDLEQRLVFARKVKTLAKKKSLKLIIGKDLHLALKIKADGVHFSDADISWSNYLRYKKFARKNFIFTCASHKISSIIKAKNLGLDGVFYSPIFATKSHPGQGGIGVLKLAKITHKIPIPIFALGGINNQNIKSLLRCKIAGIGGIDYILSV